MRVVMPCVLAVGLLTVVLLPAGNGRAQDKAKGEVPPAIGLPKDAIARPGPGGVAPERATIAQLVESLKQIRKQKADLNKQEQDTIVALRERIEEQRQQLQELERQLQELGVRFDEPRDSVPIPLPAAPRDAEKKAG
jgi:small-conductance mechanosensitive channel